MRSTIINNSYSTISQVFYEYHDRCSFTYLSILSIIKRRFAFPLSAYYAFV